MPKRKMAPGPRRTAARFPLPLEHDEHCIVADWLRLRPSILWTTVPNERKDVRIAAKLKRAGVARGVPDILIFSPPPGRPGRVGVALELKRADGGNGVSPPQQFWLAALEAEGWYSFVAHGATAAIQELERLGY